jgi:hypothetical protein
VTAFYAYEGGLYVPSPATVGPWDPALQHGGPVAALLGTRIEQAVSRGDMRVGHFALEFLSPVPTAPMTLTSAVTRPGKKIAMWSATAATGDRACVRASAWLLHTRADTNAPSRDEPPPPLPETVTSTYFLSVPRFGYGDALEWRFAEGSFESLGPSAVWSRLRVAIVAGEEVSPLGRVLAMVDSANGISAELDVERYIFVPVNLSVSLARYPVGEWVGMRAVTSLASDGVGVTRARLFDLQGTLGRALQTLYIEKR